MDYKLDIMCKWERQKAMYLIERADDLNIDISGYGELSVNQNSGYTYLWCEDYPFTLYMPISCELQKSDVYVMWSDPYDGEEYEEVLTKFNDLNDIYAWCEHLDNESRNKNE